MITTTIQWLKINRQASKESIISKNTENNKHSSLLVILYETIQLDQILLHPPAQIVLFLSM